MRNKLIFLLFSCLLISCSTDISRNMDARDSWDSELSELYEIVDQKGINHAADDLIKHLKNVDFEGVIPCEQSVHNLIAYSLYLQERFDQALYFIDKTKDFSGFTCSNGKRDIINDHPVQKVLLYAIYKKTNNNEAKNVIHTAFTDQFLAKASKLKDFKFDSDEYISDVRRYYGDEPAAQASLYITNILIPLRESLFKLHSEYRIISDQYQIDHDYNKLSREAKMSNAKYYKLYYNAVEHSKKTGIPEMFFNILKKSSDLYKPK